MSRSCNSEAVPRGGTSSPWVTHRSMFWRDIDRLISAHDPLWRRALAWVFVLGALHSAAVVLRPLPIRALIEPPAPSTFFGQIEAALGPGQARLWLYIGIVVSLELAILALRLGQEFGSARMTERITRSIRGDIATMLLRGPYRQLNSLGGGAILAAASGDLDSVQRLLREALVMTAVSVLQLCLMLFVIFFVEVWLFWILVVEIAILAGAIALYASWRKRHYLQKMEMEARYLGLLSSLYQKNLDIRFTGLGAVYITHVLGLARRLYRKGLLLWHRHSTYHGIVEFVIGSSAAMCLVFLFVTAGDGPPPIGKFLVFAYYTMLIFPNLSQIGEAWPMIHDARAALARIGASTFEPEAPAPRAVGVLAPVGPQAAAPLGDIVFESVTMLGARGETILNNVTFTVREGEKVALYGESGTGKTSIIFLLLGIVTPSAGRITIGGRNVGRLSLAERKRLFCFVRASPAFVPGRVEENIALHRHLEPQRLALTLERARLAGRLAVEPEGIRTHIGDKGEPFSGGEQQRIAFARALLSDAPCLILDEALNSLDEDSELAMTQRLISDFPGKTAIVISHRRSAAQLFPRRIEMAGHGRVAIAGSD